MHDTVQLIISTAFMQNSFVTAAKLDHTGEITYDKEHTKKESCYCFLSASAPEQAGARLAPGQGCPVVGPAVKAAMSCSQLLRSQTPSCWCPRALGLGDADSCSHPEGFS